MDLEKIEKAVKDILEAIGEDPAREGLKETPGRVARMYQEIFAGKNEDLDIIFAPEKFFHDNGKGMVVEKDITFYSMCEHHLLPFFGKVHIGYIPGDKGVVGISKLARCVECFARRAQIQEHMTNQIAEAIMDYCEAKGVIVVCEAEHTCMTMRGIKKPGTKTVTIAKLGLFEDDSKLQQEFFELIR